MLKFPSNFRTSKTQLHPIHASTVRLHGISTEEMTNKQETTIQSKLNIETSFLHADKGGDDLFEDHELVDLLVHHHRCKYFLSSMKHQIWLPPAVSEQQVHVSELTPRQWDHHQEL